MTYTQMTELIKRDIIENRYILESARKTLLNDGKVFCTIRGEGIKRIGDTAKVDVATSNIMRIRRIIRKSNKILSAVTDFNSLPNESKIRHNAMMSIGGAILQCTKAPVLKKIENKIADINKVLPVNETLELFK